MTGISHEDMLHLGRTVMPLRMEKMKELVDEPVDEHYGSYRLKGTPNSADFSFVRIGDRGYIDLRFNPHWIHQFHPEEWPAIERRMELSPWVKPFGSNLRQTKLLSQKNWDRHFKSRYEDTVNGR